jgi:hypothetical protein
MSEQEDIETKASAVVRGLLQVEELPELAFYAARRCRAVIAEAMGRESRVLDVYDRAMFKLIRRRSPPGKMEMELLGAYARWAATHRALDPMPGKVRAGQIVAYTGSALAGLASREMDAADLLYALPHAKVATGEQEVAWRHLELAAAEGRPEA